MFCNWIYKKLWFDFYPLFWFKWFVFDEHSTWKWLNMSALKIDYRIIYALKCNHEANDKLYNVRTWFEWLLSDLKTKKNIQQQSFVMVLKFKRIFDHRQMFDVICIQCHLHGNKILLFCAVKKTTTTTINSQGIAHTFRMQNVNIRFVCLPAFSLVWLDLSRRGAFKIKIKLIIKMNNSLASAACATQMKMTSIWTKQSSDQPNEWVAASVQTTVFDCGYLFGPTISNWLSFI